MDFFFGLAFASGEEDTSLLLFLQMCLVVLKVNLNSAVCNNPYFIERTILLTISQLIELFCIMHSDAACFLSRTGFTHLSQCCIAL